MRRKPARPTLGSYQLIERISRGADFEVWKAWHVRLGRPAAVKLLHARSKAEGSERLSKAVRRLVCEAQLTASLQSPHVVQIHDLGIDGERTVYFAMEYLDGLDLEHFVYRFGAVEPRRAVRWLGEVCHALGELHARGLIHGDVKPSNVFVSRGLSDIDRVTLLDFGLARATTSTHDSAETAHVRRPGTLGYMAPEQILGSSEDARSDVFAVGCLAYWMLTGVRAFNAGDDPDAGQIQDHAVPAPPLPTFKHPRSSRLEAVIMSCLSKNPMDRPVDAWALQRELVSGLDGDAWSDAEASAWWGTQGVGVGKDAVLEAQRVD